MSPTVRDIFCQFGPEYIDRHGAHIPKNHLQTIEAITKCRSAECGLVVYECTSCSQIHHAFRSCGNRHCPTCQSSKGIQWLERRLDSVVPGHHFMITFTVPDSIRQFIRSHQRVSYNAMFKASSDALKKLALDERFIGGDVPGFLGVLHTWGNQVQYHPHVHCIVPGGAFSTQDGKWHPSRIDFFVPVRALSKIYKAKFRDEIRKAGLYKQVPKQAWEIDWNVNSQPVGAAEQSIKYLAPYVFKVAITDHRIISVTDGNVTFRYRKSGSRRFRTMTVDAMEFIRRFLHHVLPSGFMKVRYYGFMSPNSSVPLEKIRALIELSFAFEIEPVELEIPKPEPLYCPICGGVLKYLYSILPYQMVPRKDSG